MKLSPRTLTAIAKTLCGDEVSSRYRSGPNLVEFFNNHGSNDEYSYRGGFPTRWVYAKEKLTQLNGKGEMSLMLADAFSPAEFIECEGLDKVLEHVNKYLVFDGYEIKTDGKKTWVIEHGEKSIVIESPSKDLREDDGQFVDEQIEKAERKIAEGDYDGAITNARSLVEAVLVSIERDFDPNAKAYDGSLPRLYKRIQKHLNISPDRDDVSESLKQVLSGLTSIVNGVSSIRNKMSDSHAQSYKPSKHHARLTLNCAKVFVEFVLATKQYQGK
ncbi:MAG: abortive infection family protein [Nitrospira sp. SB0662_bin_26]|nr:abortive infection family protein [Nitrospira sp. SB0662_bin_26]